MNIELFPGHFVAIVGGAVAGSEAAARLSERGIYTVVIEQNVRPYGKIEDGLPKWHVKLQAQEEAKINEKLSRPNIFFVPNVKLGNELDFHDLATNWGFSAVLLANGAWRDRPLPIDGIDQYVGKGLVYQNPLVKWFNHYHEHNYDGERYEIPDGAIIVGGGLASLDVVKIVMLETVLAALKKRGIQSDILTLEHKTIRSVLDENHLTLDDLGLQGCTLYYRRRKQDMPLAAIPDDAKPERLEKIYQSRVKILENFQSKYLFKFSELRVPAAPLVENDRLAGLIFKQAEIVDGRFGVKDDTKFEVRAPLVISSIGSIPEPIAGIDMNGELYDIVDKESGQVRKYKHVFALGNVVTGKGNIKASLTHGRQVSEHVMESFLAWRAEDYQELVNRTEQSTRAKIDEIARFLSTKGVLGVEKIEEIINRIRNLQQQVNYNGNYQEWINAHALEKIEAAFATDHEGDADG
jgi:NADPH-dependent glutamate synthase beta subunit-like oxidoreductase